MGPPTLETPALETHRVVVDACRSKPEAVAEACNGKTAPALVQVSSHLRRKAPEDRPVTELGCWPEFRMLHPSELVPTS